MKKRFKKMSLSRETLRTLDGHRLGKVAGGYSFFCTRNPTDCAPASGCASCDGTCHTCDTCPPCRP
jgi:hypothetical protein